LRESAAYELGEVMAFVCSVKKLICSPSTDPEEALLPIMNRKMHARGAMKAYTFN
jgi:hypothetical protein